MMRGSLRVSNTNLNIAKEPYINSKDNYICVIQTRLRDLKYSIAKKCATNVLDMPQKLSFVFFELVYI